MAFRWQGEICRETVRLNGQILPPTAANRKYAMRLAATVQAEIGAGAFDYARHFPDSPRAEALKVLERTFGQLADLWLQSKGRLAPATRDQYATAVRFWKKLLGADTPLKRIDHALLAAKVGGYTWPSPKTHNNYLIALRGMMGMEYRGARALDNPVVDIDNMPPVKKLPDPLSAAERDRILADLRERYDVRVYAYFLWMFFTGMRPEEAIALRWSDIDFATGTARVQRVRTFKGSERDGTKTNVERDVDLVPPALEALRLMKPYTYLKTAARAGEDDTAADIFENPVTGRPWHDERSQRDHYWKPALKRTGVRYRTSYKTRSTFLSVGLMGGVNPAYLASQAGHSVQTLYKDYARWIPGADGGSMKAVMAGAMNFSLESPQPASPAAKSLKILPEFGRRDWIRTKKRGNEG